MSILQKNMLCPLDDRYHEVTSHIELSEDIYYTRRVEVELRYLKWIQKVLNLPFESDSIPTSIPIDLERIKTIEKTTRHDVKAIEYYIAELFPHLRPYVHIGLTSQDVNSTAYSWMIRDATMKFIDRDLGALITEMESLVKRCSGLVTLTFTHGQPAVYSKLDKEIYVYLHRIKSRFDEILLCAGNLTCKFGGAIGNFNALAMCFPNVDWPTKLDEFISTRFNLTRSVFTTQIDDYDELCALFDSIKRLVAVCNSFAQNMWLYVSKSYFRQKRVAGEIGSSTMPHKVNPIHFENAMGNCDVVTGIIEAIVRSLPVSRMQRDLKDSTITRSSFMIFGYVSLIVRSLSEGVSRLQPCREVLQRDVDNNTQVMMEGVQTLLRLKRYDNAYEMCKAALDDNSCDNFNIEKFQMMVRTLPISDEDKDDIVRKMKPETYVGQTPVLGI